MKKPRVFVSIAAVAAILGCMRATATMEGAPVQQQQPAAAPQLIVFITVDQLRGDMLDRYSRDLTRGYATLMKGAWFTNGYQDHAITETAPGHASTMSGRFPRSTGILDNAAGVNTSAFPLINGGPRDPGASPERFQGTTLFDWIKAKSPASRALSVSRKDRGAILPIGRARENIYWYSSPTGNFTTSTFYRDTLPSWVTAFNARRIAQSYAGKMWSLSRPASAYSEPDTVAEENQGRSVFPYRLPDDSAGARGATAALTGTPTLDSLTALFALEGVRQMGLGNGPHTDVLAVSFSSTDAVGHQYGPDSREAHENEIRLDETIGWFMDSLFAMRNPRTILVALTADHGVQPIAALARRRGEATGNQGISPVSLRDLVASVKEDLSDLGVDSAAFLYDAQLVGLNRAAVRAKGLNADSILNAFRRAVLQVPGVARVDWMRDLRKADFAADPIARRWVHQIGDNASIDMVITLTRYSTWYAAVATHGSPYDQDAHVPIIFYGPWAKPGRYADFARTVDIAPTLAQMIGVRPLERLDGVILTKALVR